MLRRCTSSPILQQSKVFLPQRSFPLIVIVETATTVILVIVMTLLVTTATHVIRINTANENTLRYRYGGVYTNNKSSQVYAGCFCYFVSLKVKYEGKNKVS